MVEADKNELMYVIEKNPGLTSYEWAKRLGWYGGKVQYHLRQLLEDNETVVKEEHGTSRSGKRIYVVGWKEMVDWTKIKRS